MIKITGDKHSGKTTSIIIAASEEDSQIICHQYGAKERILERAEMMQMRIREPMTYEEYLNYKGEDIKSVCIDDLNLFAKYVCKHSIVAVSINCDWID